MLTISSLLNNCGMLRWTLCVREPKRTAAPPAARYIPYKFSHYMFHCRMIRAPDKPAGECPPRGHFTSNNNNNNCCVYKTSAGKIVKVKRM